MVLFAAARWFILTEHLQQGRIVKGIGGFYTVRYNGGSAVCKARGKFRRDGMQPMVGDLVTFRFEPGDEQGYLMEILPRSTALVRPPIANIDRLFVVAAPKNPMPDLFTLDKIIAVALANHIEPIVVCNKEELDPAEASRLVCLYQGAGVDALQVSAALEEGREQLLTRMKGHICALAGSSGVGKSSLANLIAPGIDMEVGQISDRIARGKNTTRHVELFELEPGTFFADTPGFGSFEAERLEGLTKDNLADCFTEFLPYRSNCYFTSCSHTKEKGCSVLQACADGKIAPSRHTSYCLLYEQLQKIKGWER